MARFIQPQQQQIIPMYTPKNIDFYSGILNKAQGDLERATAMKAAALEKYGDLTAYTQEDRDLTWGAANKDLANVLDADFVSPSRVASAVMETNKKVMPYVQALKAKDKEAQLQRQLRAQWGTDFIGNDVANMAIADASGQAVDPSSIRGINYNAEQFRKMFHESYGANLLNKVEGALKSSGRAGILTRETVKGLTKQTKDALLSPGSPEAIRLASQNFASLPEDTQKDLAAIYGGVEGAIGYLQQENYKAAFDPKYNFERSYQDVRDPSFTISDGGRGSPKVPPIFTAFSNPIDPKQSPELVSNYQKYIDLYKRVSANKGKFEIISDALPGVVKGIGISTFDARGVSEALGSHKVDNVMKNNLIDAAIVVRPDLESQLYRDKSGDWKFKNDASRNLFGKVLYEANRSDDSNLIKVARKHKEAKDAFMKEYKPTYDYLTKVEGMSRPDALTHITALETMGEKTYSYGLNNPKAGDNIRAQILGASGTDFKIYKVDQGTGNYGKSKDKKVLSEGESGELINTRINAKTGSIELTFDKDGDINIYAIKNDSPGLSDVNKNYLKAVEEFVDSFYSFKELSSGITAPGDRDQFGEVVYQINKNPMTGEKNVQELRASTVEGKKQYFVVKQSVDPQEVINKYLTTIFGSTTINNPGITTSFQ